MNVVSKTLVREQKLITPPASASVLVVEDEALVAFDLEDMLTDLGFSDIVVCTNYGAAEQALSDRTFTHAVFDLNLDGKMSFPLIAKARELGYTVIITSGYEPKTVAVDDASIPRLIKPYNAWDLAGAIGVRAH